MPESNTSIWLLLRVLNYLVLVLLLVGLFFGWHSRFYFEKIKTLKPVIRYTLLPYVAVLFTLIVMIFLTPLYLGFVNFTPQHPIDMIILSINGLIATSYTFIVYAFLTAPKGKAVVCKIQSIIAVIIAYYLDRYFQDWLFHGRPWLAMMFVFIVAIVVYYRFFKDGKAREFISEPG